MGLFKGIKDMVQMVEAAPALIESSQELAANAQAQAAAAQQLQAGGGAQAYVNSLNTQLNGEVKPGNLEAVSGVSLESYTAVIKELGSYGNDQSKLPQIAQSKGISPTDWEAAKEVWGARIQDDRALGSKFNALYTQG
jgi:hypothetical protein